jgi:sodium transport system ATP-binding protein
VLLDEPTNGLDVVSARALRRMLLRLKEAGKCLVFSSHVMQEVEALCERVVVVAKGQTLHEGTVDALKTRTGKASLEDAFVHLAFDGREATPWTSSSPCSRRNSSTARETVGCGWWCW